MRILITGGTNGMGKGVALALASDQASKHEIIILCRNASLGMTTVKELEGLNGHHKISMVQCDLARLKDVKTVIGQLQETYDYLDGIFINAGIGYAPKREVTEDGMMAHFQVNYLAQFMLTLNLLNLLEASPHGGRVIFNATRRGTIHWEDLQLSEKWSYEEAIHQAMVAKRMFLRKLHDIYLKKDTKVSFVGFEISKTVWTNQIQIIPFFMKAMASLMKILGAFITIEACGKIIVPLLTEGMVESQARSGTFITWKKNAFQLLEEEGHVVDTDNQNRLWDMSLELCSDEITQEISKVLEG